MDFSLNEDQLAVRDLARQLLGGAAPAAGAGSPTGDAWLDAPLWRHLGEAGLLGIALPEEVGGAGRALTDLALAAEEAGRSLARVPLAACVAGAALPVARFGGPALRDRLLPGVVAGTHVLTSAFAEPFADDPMAPATVAAPDGDGWLLSGTRTAVPLARQAAAVLVPAQTAVGTVVVAMVDPHAPGVTLHDEATSSGEPAATMVLDGVAVGSADVLPGEALPFAYQRYLLTLCATELGIAQEALQRAAAHTSAREQFGRPLATFQAVAVRLANGFIDVQAMQSTLWQALWLLDEGRDAGEQVITAAFWAAEGGERVLTSAVHLHGGIGVDTDYPLHRWFLASKVVELSLGGASWQLDRLGRALAAR